MRVGLGYDVHQLVEGRPLVLGGVRIAHTVGLAGHSDADVLIHAIIDALLGAAALGDIGTHFPDTDDEWKGADSYELLCAVVKLITAAGWGVVNVDSTVSAQAPKLKQHIPAMRSRIADGIGIDIDRISIKATTTERLGFVGREEGLEARAICLVERR
ncbi:MAG: 2-C-methyl-D-erythritol 2,4-cyclodiphosphate synthase [Rhodothermales bacterium]|nr:2-C-methyl-D-erythritol 2,4-cyclodiphosphate synthase [Rhodothermales bacterium]